MPVLARYETTFGTITVTRSWVTGEIAYVQNGCYHSQARRDGTSICVYLHIIQEILRQTKARDVLIIGGAGGTLATMLRRQNCRVTIVDINPAAFTIARRFFRLPQEVRCIRRDGVAFLRTSPMSFDAIVIDVFATRNQVPKNFTTPPFFQLVKKNLAANGRMIMNVITANDEERTAHRIAAKASDAGFDISLLDWPGFTYRNSLLISDLPRSVRIPSGHEPDWIKNDYEGLVRRKARR